MVEKEKRTHHRAKFKWPVLAKVDGKVIEGVTKDISASGAYVCCANPLKLNTVFDMVIKAPEKRLKVKAVRFLNISSDDRKVIAKEILQHLKPDEEIDSKQLKALKTLTINPKDIGPKPE